jgi:hypothetical protein
MEELALYLRSPLPPHPPSSSHLSLLSHTGLNIHLQLVYENQRTEGGPLDVLDSLFLNLNAPWVAPPKFIPTMKKTDPNHWMTSTGEPIAFLKDLTIPSEFVILKDWKAEVISQVTDSEGWEYNREFISQGWVERCSQEYSSSCLVRRRKWYRIAVHATQLHRARDTATDYMVKLPLLRSFNPYLLSNCFSTQSYRLQFILECQRSAGGFESFSSLHLKSSDPYVWSIAHPNHCFIDPTTPAITQLYNAHHVLYSNPHGASCLHEFIFTLYPNKDSNGWEYNSDFYLPQLWSPDYTPSTVVRRRLWFRTILPSQSFLYPYRALLCRYVEIHPRGNEIKKGEIQFYHRKRWNHGLLILTSSSLFVYTLENENVPELEYKLQGTEVVAISRTTNPHTSATATGATISSSSPSVSGSGNGNSSRTLTEETFPRTQSLVLSSSSSSSLSLSPLTNTNSKLFLFTLNQIGSRGKDLGSVGLFNASSSEDLEDWLCAITHQTALVHPIFWPIRFGPPLVDTLILEGDLWKKGNFIPNWTLRRFELRQDGTLSYFRGRELRGKMRLRGCLVREGIDDTTIEINKNNGQSFVMKTLTSSVTVTTIASSASVSVSSSTSGVTGGGGEGMLGGEISRTQWIEAIKLFTNQNKRVVDDTLVDDDPIPLSGIIEESLSGHPPLPFTSTLLLTPPLATVPGSRQSRKARLATVTQKRSVCIRESESPYLPHGASSSSSAAQYSLHESRSVGHPPLCRANEINLELETPYLDEEEEESGSDSESERDSEEVEEDDEDKEDDLKGKRLSDLLDDEDLYADGPTRDAKSATPVTVQSSSSSSAQQMFLPPSRSPPRTTSSSLPQRQGSHHKSPPSSSPSKKKTPSSSTPLPSKPLLPLVSSASTAGFASYEEYVAARKKAAATEQQQNPYLIGGGGGQVENPYLSSGDEESGTVEGGGGAEDATAAAPYASEGEARSGRSGKTEWLEPAPAPYVPQPYVPYR